MKLGHVVIDVEGLALTGEDRDLLSHPLVAGIVLFSRNFESRKQLRRLTHEINAVSSDIFISVDQEGGRVQRFRDGFTELPSMQYWGEGSSVNPSRKRC